MRSLPGALALTILIGAGCAPRNLPAPEETPAWKTEEGRKGLWRDLAAWYIDNDMPGQALDMVRRLHEADVHEPQLDLIQGRALSAQGMTEEARHILEDVRDKLRRDPRPYRALGVVYADAGETDRAIDALQKAVELGDDDEPATRNNLGFLLMASGRCAEAIPHLEAVLALDGTNVRYRNNLAFSLVCTGEHQRALTLFRSTGDEADARYNMGVAYERLDKLPSAILQYQHALESDPEHDRAREAFARLEPLDLLPDAELPRLPDPSSDGDD